MFKRGLAIALGVTLSAIAGTGLAQAAAPVVFGTVSGVCSNSMAASHYGAPVSASHPSVLVSYEVDAGFASFDLEGDVQAGDVVWGTENAIAVNESPTVYVSCWSSPVDAPFTATYYDRPATPATFSGAGGLNGSRLGFKTPGTAQYVADLQLSGGGVNVSGGEYGSRQQNFASSGQLALGTLQAGEQTLTVTALDGPRPNWTVTIRALPVAIGELGFKQPMTRPGAFVQADYSTTGDTAITAVVYNGVGQAVKTLASGLAVSAGEHSLPWDARDNAGQPLPDGAYTLRLDSTDPSGNTSSASTAITVDGTPPGVVVTSPATIAPNQAVSGQLSDGLSGVAGATVKGEYGTLDLPAGATSFTYVPEYGDWDLGANQVVITAADHAGNERTVTHNFTVAKPKPTTSTSSPAKGPSCTKSGARKAIVASNAARRAVRRTGNLGGQGVFDVYGVGKVLCRDLNGDGRKDMGVLVVCCTVSSYSPFLVFRNTKTGWKLAFSKSKVTIFKVFTRGRTFRLKTPRYRRTDANCCPSSYRYYKVYAKRGKVRIRRANG